MVLLDPLVDSRWMVVLQSHVGLGVLRKKPLHVLAHQVQPDGINRGHADAPIDLVVHRPHFLFEGLVSLDELAALGVVMLALRREDERSLGGGR